ncbi:exosortase H-associated membrane protein [uncultured Thiothrix sp.]|uniref:exosortase H-associated membrane protein n=1 Tax=uncultured Thiothrix sp. TaxID=223185 RepID=UPI0026356467|nr:exosortase H-associated membrane protein [uncultured Thiothrix sp.]
MFKACYTTLFKQATLSPRLFVLRTLFWLPLLFIIWYLLSSWLIHPALELAKLLIPLGLPNLIESLAIQQHYLIINTYLGAEIQAELPQGFARFTANFFTNGQHYPFLLSIPLDSLKYAYGLPVLTALVLATPTSIRKKLLSFGLGFVLVSLIVVWGLYFNTANFLALDFKTTFTDQAKTLWPLLNETWMQACIALGYRLGFLIFPVVLPIALWAQLNPAILSQLIYGSNPKPNPSSLAK